MLVLTRKEVEQLLDPHELLGALEEGFRALSAGALQVPPRTQLSAPAGALLGMYAGMAGKALAVKLVSVFHASVPSHRALITLFDAGSGAPLALMDGECITALRTAAAALLSIRLLARADARTVAIVGGGVQAASHLAMLGVLGNIERVWIAARDVRHAGSLAARAPNARVAQSAEQAVRAADIVCLCTSAPEPVLRSAWLKPGTHLSSVGYRPPGSELPPDLVASSRLFVESRHAFDPPPAGCAELTGLDPAAGTELGEVLLGQRPGRTSAQETTLYKSMGHAMEDLVAADLVYRKALTLGLGNQIEL